MKFCKDCKYFLPTSHSGLGTAKICTCPAPQFDRFRADPVMGVPKEISCDVARTFPCEVEGKFWEPKE